LISHLQRSVLSTKHPRSQNSANSLETRRSAPTSPNPGRTGLANGAKLFLFPVQKRDFGAGPRVTGRRLPTDQRPAAPQVPCYEICKKNSSQHHTDLTCQTPGRRITIQKLGLTGLAPTDLIHTGS
jgi:hypothetical protein